MRDGLLGSQAGVRPNHGFVDVRTSAAAITEFYRFGSHERLGKYSETCLRRVWKEQRSSPCYAAVTRMSTQCFDSMDSTVYALTAIGTDRKGLMICSTVG